MVHLKVDTPHEKENSAISAISALIVVNAVAVCAQRLSTKFPATPHDSVHGGGGT